MKICNRCHIAKRNFAANGWCSDCESERQRLDYFVASGKRNDDYLYRHARNRAAEYERSLELKREDRVEPDPFADDLSFASLFQSKQRERRWNTW